MRTRKYKRYRNKTIKVGGGIKDTLANIVLGYAGLQRKLTEQEQRELCSKLESEDRDMNEILSKGSDFINDLKNDPENKEKIEQAVNYLKQLADIFIDASEEPIQRMISKLMESYTKVLSALGSGAVKVASDVAGAIPFVGAAIDLGKALNDGMHSARRVVDAGTSVIDTATQSIDDVKDIMKIKMDELKEKQDMAKNTYNRTYNSMKEFTKPATSLTPKNITTGAYNSMKKFVSPITSLYKKNPPTTTENPPTTTENPPTTTENPPTTTENPPNNASKSMTTNAYNSIKKITKPITSSIYKRKPSQNNTVQTAGKTRRRKRYN